MTKRTYICNVCRDEFPSDKVDVDIIGFAFVSSDMFRKEPCYHVENHICLKCLEGISWLHKQYHKEQPKGQS